MSTLSISSIPSLIKTEGFNDVLSKSPTHENCPDDATILRKNTRNFVIFLQVLNPTQAWGDSTYFGRDVVIAIGTDITERKQRE